MQQEDAPRTLSRLLDSPVALRRYALANLLANSAIVVTGGAVRLTGSGLGCPTWPKCTATDWTTTPQMGVHGMIEFGNRTLTGVLGVVALLALWASWRQRRDRPDLWRPAFYVLFGIVLQGVVGGITVLTGLNPYIVGLHFVLSVALIAAAHTHWRRCRATPAEAANREPRLRPLAWLVTMVSLVVLLVGVVVTGSGPHSGDPKARRIGLDAETISQLHVDTVFAIIGLAVAGWFAARLIGANSTTKAFAVLVAVLLGQGVIGFVQYFTSLPPVLVGLHLLGSCLVWVATLELLWSTRRATATAGPSLPDRHGGRSADDLVAA